MSFVSSKVMDSLKQITLGIHADTVLKQAGVLCQQGSGETSVVGVTDLAVNDCSVFAKTCLKVAFIGTLLTSIMPFLFGTMSAAFSFGALTCCVLTHDVIEIIKCFSQLEKTTLASPSEVTNPASIRARFVACSTQSARVAFMVHTTMLLGWMPTRLLERSGEWLGFIPATPSADGVSA